MNEPSRVSHATPQESARQSLLNTPLWLPIAVAVVGFVALVIVVPRSVHGAIAGISILAGVALTFAGLASVVIRYQTGRRMSGVLASLTTLDAVHGMSQLELHDLVTAALIKRAWHEDRLPGGAVVDDAVIMSAEHVRRAVFFVRSRIPLRADTLRDFEKRVRGKARPLVITTAGFAPESIVFARQIGAELIDAQGVLSLMSELRGEAPARGPLPAPTFVWEDEALQGKPQQMVSTGTEAKTCPTCGGPMRQQHGATMLYWVCAKFPECGGIVISQ